MQNNKLTIKIDKDDDEILSARIVGPGINVTLTRDDCQRLYREMSDMIPVVNALALLEEKRQQFLGNMPRG